MELLEITEKQKERLIAICETLFEPQLIKLVKKTGSISTEVVMLIKKDIYKIGWLELCVYHIPQKHWGFRKVNPVSRYKTDNNKVCSWENITSLMFSQNNVHIIDWLYDKIFDEY